MKTSLFFATCLLSFSIFFISCNKESRRVPVQILLTDNPDAYDSVNIHIKQVKLKLHRDNAGWTDIASKDTTVNLLDLQNGVTMLLAQDSVPAGILKEVRFILGEDNYIVLNGVRHELQTPSAEDAGLKIKIDKDLGESLNSFTLDFDAALSIKEQNGDYKLMPVIKLK